MTTEAKPPVFICGAESEAGELAQPLRGLRALR